MITNLNKNEINLAIIITTYNRYNYLIKNLNALNHCRNLIKQVYVIDNASNLPPDLGNDFIKIISNKNLGGSGGYARGMLEARKNSNLTHILLMDDDIEFDPSNLKNAIDKLNVIGKEDWFAFGMKTFENQERIYENTAYWSGIIRKPNFRNVPIAEIDKMKKYKYNYAAWWALIMPITVIDKYGYPLPYFIKADDIEYGMRRKEEKIYFDNHITVFHEDFEKKYNLPMHYYCIRNHMTTNILHFKHSLIKSCLMYILRMAKAWMLGNFAKLELSTIGFKDFLLGPDFYKNIDLEENNKRIIELSSEIKFIFFKFILYPFIVAFYTTIYIFKHHKLKKDYLANYKYLTSEEFWVKQFKK